jgi:hypothetical protein
MGKFKAKKEKPPSFICICKGNHTGRGVTKVCFALPEQKLHHCWQPDELHEKQQNVLHYWTLFLCFGSGRSFMASNVIFGYREKVFRVMR